ncbi:MAG: hypothetical protein ACOCX9_06165 [Spirochaetota bacterium]
MRLIVHIFFIIYFSLFSTLPGEAKKITPQLFLKIETRILESDMKEETRNRIIRNHDVSVDQYNRYQKKIENDPKLKGKLGKLRMKMYSDLYTE